MVSLRMIWKEENTMDPNDFIAEIAPMAVEDMMQSTVLASITIAQGCLESADGNHAPGNNLFGIKSDDNTGQLLWTQEYVKGKWIKVQAWFKIYTDWSGSICDHSDFLHHSRYAEVLKASANLDYRAAAKALQAAGYATDPNYAQSLINIIESNKLYLYDKEAFKNMQQIIDLQSRVTALETQNKPISAPSWFIDEFTLDELKDLINTPYHVPVFWENLAVTLRALKKS